MSSKEADLNDEKGKSGRWRVCHLPPTQDNTLTSIDVAPAVALEDFLQNFLWPVEEDREIVQKPKYMAQLVSGSDRGNDWVV